MITVGSLCTGYGGLELALAHLDAVRLVWCADNDPAAVRLLAHHYPDVPNLLDLTAVDWSAVPSVDAITAGWPCQPWSLAGKQKGSSDARAIWPAIATAIRTVRPRYVYLENVSSIAGAGELARACGDLAEAGYVGAWDCKRASDVGAPHRRLRLFIAARSHSGSEAVSLGDRPRRVQPHGEPGHGSGLGDGASANSDGANGAKRRRQRSDVSAARGKAVRGGSPKHGGLGGAAADSAGERRGEGRSESAGVERGPDAAERGGATCRHCPHSIDFHDADGFCIHCSHGCYWGADYGVIPDADGEPVGAQPVTFPRGGGAAELDPDGQAAPDADRDGRECRPERDGQPVEPQLEPPLGRDAHGRLLDWAGYAPAIERWESRMGRPAPDPTLVGRRGGLQLNPEFVEWLMGLPAGHVTAVPGLTRNQKLKLLGNGVVPLQAAAAYAELLPVLEMAVAA